MKKQYLFSGFLLVGIGIFFLLRQLSIPFIHHVYSWPTVLMMIGFIYLLYSYLSKDYKHILPGAVFLGIGIHLYGQNYYTFWIDHWTIYPLILGSAFLLRFSKTKKGLVAGVLLIILALAGAFSPKEYVLFQWLQSIVVFFESYWPLIFIFTGLAILYKNKKPKRS